MLALRRVAVSATALLLAVLAASAVRPTGPDPSFAAPYRDCPSGLCTDPSNSFDPDTRVRMADATLCRIDAVLVGDLVATPDGGVTEVQAVIQGTGDKDLVEVNATLTATANHRLLTERGWVSAGQLVIGDLLVGPGAPVRVDTLRTDRRYGTVMNLDVSGPGTYLVSLDGTDVTVHE